MKLLRSPATRPLSSPLSQTLSNLFTERESRKHSQDPTKVSTKDFFRTDQAYLRSGNPSHQMTQREQAVKGIFAIERVISPMSVKTTGIGPKSVDKIKARLFNAIERDLQSCQSVQGSCSGKEVRQGRIWHGKKSSLLMTAGEQPLACGRLDRRAQMAEDRNCRRGGIRRTHLEIRIPLIRPRAIPRFE